MKKIIKMLYFVLFITQVIGLSKLPAQPSVDIETGMVFSGYNDVQIPRATGTRISLYNELKTDPGPFFRVRLNYEINNRHWLSLLVAPLRLYGSGSVNQDVIFAGDTFLANKQLKSRYRFDSYRLSYRYKFFQNEKIQAGIGLTAKIRDASISLEDNNNNKSEKTNTGFVPLINFDLKWLIGNNLNLVLNCDALGATQGRAEDVMLALQYNLNKNVDMKAGYRFVEGGADVAGVYNFTLINYALAGLIVKF
jgi:hypothetical protein